MADSKIYLQEGVVMPIELFTELFYYDGLNLRNKITRSANAMQGHIVGGRSKSGYLVTSVNHKKYMVHRVIYALYHSVEISKDMEIDHINGVKTDNRINNLRLVTHSENMRNRKLHSNNKSGRIGVYFIKSRNKWCSQIKAGGRIVYLGEYANFEDAVNARIEAENKYNFHVNHGRQNG